MHDAAGIYLFKVSNGNSRKICEIYSNLIIKTSDRRLMSLWLIIKEKKSKSGDKTDGFQTLVILVFLDSYFPT